MIENGHFDAVLQYKINRQKEISIKVVCNMSQNLAVNVTEQYYKH